jgi:hypothetical protein
MKTLIENILTCTTNSNNWESTLDEFNKEFRVTASAMFAINKFEDSSVNFYMSEIHILFMTSTRRLELIMVPNYLNLGCVISLPV